MKLIHLISGGDVGGAKTHVLSLLQGLNRTEDVHLICFMEGPFAEEARCLGIPTTVIEGSNPMAVRKRILAIIRHDDCQLLHCHGARANMIGALVQRQARIPVISTIHSDYRLDYLGRPLAALTYGNINKVALRRFDAWIGVSDGMRQLLISRGSKMSVFISLFTIALNAILAENFILVKFMGICPFMGVSKKQDTALGMGIAVTFVMGIASAATWAVNEFLLVPLNLVYMQTVVFILVIAALVQLVEMFLQKAVPALYQALGIYLPLITTNCAVLGVALLNIQDGYNFVESLVYGITGGIGFTVAILLFSSVRERLEDCDCPKAFRGFPIALLAAGLLALSFMGFSGFKVFG